MTNATATRPLLSMSFFILLLLLPNITKGTDSPGDQFQHVIAGPDGYSAEPCVVPSEVYDDNTEITEGGIEFVRTPDDAFVDLAANGYPWSPNYVEVVDGLRMHYLDVCGNSTDACSDDDSSEREIVLLLHGQPTWSFLYRKMIPVLASRGYRIYAPDWIGFGKSDKPIDMAEHTYLKQVDCLKSFISQVIPRALKEPTINLFVQDWGSLIGLRAVGDEPHWFKRVIVANGALPAFPVNVLQNPNIVNYDCNDNRTVIDMVMDRRRSAPCGADLTCFSIWMDFALKNPSWMPSELVNIASSREVMEGALAMYDTAFVSRRYMAGPRAFPSMIAAVHEPEFGNVAAWKVLMNFSRPFLSLAGEDDVNLGSEAMQNLFVKNVAGASIHDFEHLRYPNTGHFIQEDAGEEVAEYVADFIDGTAHIIADDNSSSYPLSSSSRSCLEHQMSLELLMMASSMLLLCGIF